MERATWTSCAIAVLASLGIVSATIAGGFEFSLSGSPSDPYENSVVASGSGGRSVYLWLTCAGSGLSGFEAGLDTDLTVLGSFNPMNGVINIASGKDVMLGVPSCPTDSTLLGYWNVLDEPGEACLAPSQRSGLYGAVECSQFPVLAADPIAIGFAANGSPPCTSGIEGCTPGAFETAPPPRWYLVRFHANEDGEDVFGVRYDAEIIDMPFQSDRSLIVGEFGSLIPPGGPDGGKQWMQIGWGYAGSTEILWLEYRTRWHLTLDARYRDLFAVPALNQSYEFAIEPVDTDSDFEADSFQGRVGAVPIPHPVPGFTDFSRVLCASAFGIEHNQHDLYTPGSAVEPYVVGNCQEATYDDFYGTYVWDFEGWTWDAASQPTYGHFGSCANWNDVCVYDVGTGLPLRRTGQ
ncbi:MAG: hypothetical protein DHS20C21_05650 [Gemmatimonadota bacterium]|nr:MAG: hypothetical protein DHS20C21_05650 [Gemmatimonadota bacterium]